jgi:hypothetical protein
MGVTGRPLWRRAVQGFVAEIARFPLSDWRNSGEFRYEERLSDWRNSGEFRYEERLRPIHFRVAVIPVQSRKTRDTRKRHHAEVNEFLLPPRQGLMAVPSLLAARSTVPVA